MPLLFPSHDTGGWRAPRRRSLLLRRWPPAAGFAAALRAPAAPALVVLAVFAAAGAVVVDDYGVSIDEPIQRELGRAAIDYVLGDGALLTGSDRYYGISFEAPLLLAERLLGLADSRAVYLLRRLLTHLFFLAGGFFCWLLAHRLCGDRRLALFALLLYLLHPRLYAHSFVNTRDIPFLAMFMIALWLAERAFRRDTAAAFALCGAGVGVLVDLRVMGLALFAAVPGLRALDLLQARDGAGRRRALATAAAFVLAAAGTRYAVAPWLWSDPSAIVDAFVIWARHPNHVLTLFQGELVRWPSIPPRYLPTWMAITTPPAALLLALAGAAAVVRRGAARPLDVLRNTGLRFEWLLLACLVLPPAAVVALQANVYNGWRQMYFLYAPLCLLAAGGLRGLLAAAGRPRLRRGAWGLAAAALVVMAADVVRLHPYQHAYFNFLVDRSTPERLRTQYQLLYWAAEYRKGLEYLLARYPDATLTVGTRGSERQLLNNRLILPAAARDRIVTAGETGRPADFFISSVSLPRFPLFSPSLGGFYARRIYGSTVLTVKAVDLSLAGEAAADHARAAYRAAAAGEPLFRSAAFDLHLDGRTLTWVIESCRPEDIPRWFLLEVLPVDPDDLQWSYPEFRFGEYGVRFDGRCLIRRTLPDFPIRALRVGRRWQDEAGEWRREAAAIDLSAAPSVHP